MGNCTARTVGARARRASSPRPLPITSCRIAGTHGCSGIPRIINRSARPVTAPRVVPNASSAERAGEADAAWSMGFTNIMQLSTWLLGEVRLAARALVLGENASRVRSVHVARRRPERTRAAKAVRTARRIAVGHVTGSRDEARIAPPSPCARIAESYFGRSYRADGVAATRVAPPAARKRAISSVCRSSSIASPHALNGAATRRNVARPSSAWAYRPSRTLAAGAASASATGGCVGSVRDGSIRPRSPRGIAGRRLSTTSFPWARLAGRTTTRTCAPRITAATAADNSNPNRCSAWYSHAWANYSQRLAFPAGRHACTRSTATGREGARAEPTDVDSRKRGGRGESNPPELAGGKHAPCRLHKKFISKVH